ncbi:MAG: tRNA (adenosine(37)-N6)-threonylcarbamoyltransferase complex dimerization subunit type 1 TsaB [Bacteroidales bacterium]|nr:tRNA (adenosine(37)-N6)-threonylcarbamoyltransferase complex dimerization subunit type 1 TsaB [Bacteroidales bacterium]
MCPRIILIETSTSLCSTALVEGDGITAVRKSDTPRAHASMTAPFVARMLEERGLRVADCDAVCLSMGPGSYTGLRVGSSTAKGLCFGGGIPLLAVSTLDVLVAQARAAGLPEGCRYIVPMIDARRMEVYTALYTAAGERLTEIEPVVVESGGSFSATLDGVLFIGDGVAKCEEVLAGDGRWLRQECPTAEAMMAPALEEFRAGHFRDTAYFEPFYLKDFVATTGKKLF